MIADAPGLPPWVLAYAEYGSVALAIVDHEAAGCRAIDPHCFRFTVTRLGGAGTGSRYPCAVIPQDWDYERTNLEAEARRVFWEHAHRLLEGEP